MIPSPAARTHAVRTALAAAGLTALLAGCGAQAEDAGSAPRSTPSASTSASPHTHVMPDGTVMKGSSMKGMKMSPSTPSMPSASSSAAPSGSSYDDGMSKDYSKEDKNGDGRIERHGVGGQPSETATMVCADQIEKTVQRTFDLRTEPVGTPSWNGATYTCTYRIGGAPLVASVRDDTTDSATQGLGWFHSLERHLPGARPMKGIIGLGFPSYESPAGHVVFLKDHKTLHVDASSLPASALPKGFSREDVAYAVASAVMVCWSA